MSDYTIKMRIDVSEDSGEVSKPIEVELTIPETQASSIDGAEQAFLQLSRETLRKAISQHLEDISKKKPKLSRKELVEELKKRLENTGLMEK